MVEKHARDLSETQAALYDEGQQKARLQMELDSKDSEIEQLRQKLTYVNIDTASMNSSTVEDNESAGMAVLYMGLFTLINPDMSPLLKA